MRIVLDTNVLIAAFIANGVCSDLFEHCVQRHELLTSEFVLNEFQDTLVRKFRYTRDESEEAVELLHLVMEVVVPVIFENQVSRDADDDAVLGTAISGEADCIITGDQDLLVLKQFMSVDIVRPAEFPEYEAATI